MQNKPILKQKVSIELKRATISAEEKKKQTNKKTELLTNKCFLLGKKVMTNLDSELKGRDGCKESDMSEQLN